ncbi:MAG: aryl-sulfate sulfotransferase [Bryobacteraceae bacterium]
MIRNTAANRFHSGYLFAGILLVASTATAGLSVNLTASQPTPQPVGTMITWSASASTGGDAPALRYRFGVRTAPAREYKILHDYGPDDTIDWTMADGEGTFEMEVSARRLDTGETATASYPFEMLSRVSSGIAVLNPTAHPLVLLYSAPPCAPGNRMQVEARAPDGSIQTTPFRDCDGRSMNLYVAGLYPDSVYTLRHFIDSGDGRIASGETSAATGRVNIDLPQHEVRIAPASAQGFLLHCPIFPNKQIATDLNGNLLWYYPGDISFITRPEPGGIFWGLVQGNGGPATQKLRAFDLAGMTVLETNAARVNEQLAAMGQPPISGFHHEAFRLPDGKIATLGFVEQILTDVQGPGAVDVGGDMVIVLDPDLNIVWTWSAFDHLDQRRAAVLNERCSQGSCPKLTLADDANDWTHANSVQPTADGNLIVSMRHQDWVLKIDYQNGNGSGNILWRLGRDGDFAMNPADPNAWFSHQHDVNFDPDNPSRLLLYDNGNTRRALDGTANSRGQVIEIDEVNRTATPVLAANLGGFSFALGAAQRLSNGNLHFGSGWFPDNSSVAMEVDPAGNIVYALKLTEAAYRSFRLDNLYSAPMPLKAEAAASRPSPPRCSSIPGLEPRAFPKCPLAGAAPRSRN